MTRPVAPVVSLDHMVLTCTSLQATITFYTQICGMQHSTFRSSNNNNDDDGDSSSTERHALTFGDQKINLHQAGAEFEPKASLARPGTADVCFVVARKVEEVCEALKREGVEVVAGGGVVERTGARGRLRSVYVRDPDGNLVEFSNYEDQGL